MKIWRKLLIYGVIAIAIQSVVLIYLNNYMSTSLSIFNSSEQLSESGENKNSGIMMPENINELQASFDGRYCSYYRNNTIYVIDTETAMRKKITLDEGQSISAFRWHSRENKIVIVGQNTTGAIRLKLLRYDAELGKKEVLRDLSWLGNDIRFGSLEFAKGDDLILSIIDSNEERELYYLTDKVRKLSIELKNVNVFKYTGMEENVLYGDEETGKYYITDSKKILGLKGKRNKIIQVDDLGKLYIIENTSEEINTVYYKDLNADNDTWHPVVLSKPVLLQNLFINIKGQVYVNSNLEAKFININNNSVIDYDGKYMAYFQGGIFTLKDNILRKLSFDDSKTN